MNANSLIETDLPTRDAVHYTGLSAATLYRYAAAGLIEPVRIGPKLLRWPIDQLNRLARGAEQAPGD